MAQDINIKVGANISDLQKKMSAAQRTMERSGKKMSALGNDLMMSVSLPLAAFGGSIIMAAANFEKAMNGMKAVTAGGIESFDELNAKAKELGATTQFSATEAAEAMEMLGRNGLTATQILEGAADASLGLAAATGTDLSNAANIATDAMSQFNIAASDMGGVADLITGATVNSKFSIDDFQLAMASAGGVAGAVGVSFQDFATTISAISPSFASGSDAGTSLKTMLTTLNPKSKEAAGLMKQLGIITANGANQFFDAAGNMKSMSDISGVLSKAFTGLSDSQKINAAQTIFGTDAMRAGLKLAEVGSENFDNLATSIEGVSAAEVAGIRMEGFSGAVMMLKSAFETLQLAIADAGVLDFATRMVQNLTALSLSMAAMNPEMLKLAVGIGFVVLAIGPMIKVIGISKLLYGQLLGNVNMVIGAMGKMAAAVRFVTSAEGISIIVTKAKNAALGVYNTTLALANGFLNLFRISTYKNIAASIAQRVATIATNAAVFAGVAIIQGVILAESAYLAVKAALTNGIKIATIAQKAFNLMLLANPIGIAIAAIVGLVAAFTLAYQNLDWFKNFVDNSLAFISDKFSGLLDKVKFVFKNFPAIFAATWKTMKALGTNISNFFKKLSLSAESFRLKFARALTIDKDKRAEITASINKIGKESKGIEENAQNLGEVFNETLAAEIAKSNVTKPKNKKDTPATPATAPPAFDFVAPDLTGGQTNMTTAVEKTTKAIKEQNVVLKHNSLGLTELQPKQLLIATGAGVMTTSMNSMEQSMRTVKLRTEEMQAAMGSFNESLSNVLAEGVTNVAVGFGEVVGSMAVGTASMSDMGSMLLGSLAGLLGQVGKLAVGTGVAMLGIKAALTNLHPAVAIAGGIALIALSKMVSSKAESLGGQMGGVPAFAMGGLVDKPTLGVFGEAGPEVLIPKKRLDSLLSKHENGGGGNGTLEAMISGNDIKIVYDRAARRNSRVGG
jgi:TP901 family phage tail tape measure protein